MAAMGAASFEKTAGWLGRWRRAAEFAICETELTLATMTTFSPSTDVMAYRSLACQALFDGWHGRRDALCRRRRRRHGRHQRVGTTTINFTSSFGQPCLRV